VRKNPFHDLHASFALIAPTLVLLGAAWLAGCAEQQVAVKGGWQDKASRSQTFSKVMVIGLSPEASQRCAFETFLAKEIRSDSVTSVTSCEAMGAKEPLSREGIERAIAAQQADAVLVTFLVASQMSMKEGGGMDTRGSGSYKATGAGWDYGYYGGYGAYGVPVIYGEFVASPSIFTLQGEVQILSRVFETRGATLVYEVKTKAKNLESRDPALMSVTGAIADRLRKDGVLR
jgi:hypothetical protein